MVFHRTTIDEAEPETRSGSLSGASSLVAGPGMSQTPTGLELGAAVACNQTERLFESDRPAKRGWLLVANMFRMNCAWQNWPGAPGVSTFYVDTGTDISTATDALRAYFNAHIALLPAGLTIQVPSNGDTISDADGTITGAWSDGTPVTVVTATGAGAYAGNAGAVVHWLTTGLVGGRRVRGRTFLVPLVASAYESNGSLSAATLTTLNTAAGTLVGALGSGMRIWHRPKPPAAGSSFDVDNHRVPDLSVSLRSRRI